MKEHQLIPDRGAHRRKRRVGRGNGSGRGNYSGRGNKGQKARSGGGVRRGFAGGTLPMMKALPMLRGFTNKFRTEYIAVNLDRLAQFPEHSKVAPLDLKKAGILKNEKRPVKILGRGILKVSITVQAHKFSKSARAAIEAAGGSVEKL